MNQFIHWNGKMTARSQRRLNDFFDRVVVVSLPRRSDRLTAFWDGIRSASWPFGKPEVFAAIDGHVASPPATWHAGAGAWGCMQSHRQVLEKALLDGVETLLVLEDDAVPCENFDERARDFLSRLPEAWDAIMLGGEHVTRPMITRESGIVRCTQCHRTHAYAVRGEFLKSLYQRWCGSVGHCDQIFANFAARHRVFAPDPFLFGQRGCKSDIDDDVHSDRVWNRVSAEPPLVFLKAPRPLVQTLRGFGFYTGRLSIGETGVDLELDRILNVNVSLTERIRLLRGWISTVQQDVIADGNLIATVCHPRANVAILRKCVVSPILEIRGTSLAEVMRQIPSHLQGRLNARPMNP